MFGPASVPGRRVGLAPLLQDERGGGTVFSLFAIMGCLMVAGLSIDAGNAWRHREILRLSADVAAHAGANVLAGGGDEMAAMTVATGATELNTPTAGYGRVIYDPFSDIEVLHYSPDSNMLSLSGPSNAVSVHLQRSARVQNPVPTYLLKLLGTKPWDIETTSVVAVVPTQSCDAGKGIYGHAGLSLEGEAVIGADFCVHSQTEVNLGARSLFRAGSGLSMPDMSNCGGMCGEANSPGIRAASSALNLIMPKPADHIDRLQSGFTDPNKALEEEAAFFATRPLATDLSALDELGLDTAKLKAGDVVRLDRDIFERARELPAGLVYNVTCDKGDAAADSILTIGRNDSEADLEAMYVEATSGEIFGADGAGAMDAPDTGEGSGEGFDDGTADSGVNEDVAQEPMPPQKNLVLVTNCLLHFSAKADVQGSLILSTRETDGLAVTADAGASAGDPEGKCAAPLQAVIMAKGGMQVPAGFTTSNANFIIGGSAMIAGNPMDSLVPHAGMSLHAGGPARFAGKHDFSACPNGLDAVLPTLNIIKYVMPTDPLTGTN